MAGILNKKQRVIDFILTDEGRSQIQRGDLEIAFATITDRDTYYEEESENVASDAQARIYFEASNRHQDRIIVESDFGKITSFTTDTYKLTGEQVLTSPSIPRRVNDVLLLTGSDVTSAASDILSSITTNFTDQQIVSTEDPFTDRQGFAISQTNLEFRPTTESPINVNDYIFEGVYRPPLVSSYDAIVNDTRFAHFAQFKFLPPVNAPTSELGGQPLGQYANMNQAEITTYDQLKQRLEGLEYKEIRFNTTSRENNIIIQPFEFREFDGTVRKLSVIDYGIFPNERGTNAGVHVFFAGKVVSAADGSKKFFNLFTIELDV